ncbi:MAG TPA: hypothetical protein VFR43_12150 [Gaiellaceae bacterium]|nr:hypothetical protein [Gaiellaceae bacterium]
MDAQALSREPGNAAVIAHLEAAAAPVRATPDDPWQLDGYELRTHPDLAERFEEVARGSGGGRAAAAGVPLLVDPGGCIVAYALGTSRIALRLPQVGGEPALDPRPVEGLPGWTSVDAWLSSLSSPRGTDVLRELVGRAVAGNAP